MRPDIEDFEELNIPAEDAPRSRAMSWLVLAVAVGGFGALAYYAYHSGTQNMQNGDVLVVQADETPIKEAPANPEGEQFANQDKTIYDVIAPNASEDKVEKLLPEPEKPVSAPQEAPTAAAPTTYVNKNLTPSTPAISASDPVKKADSAKPAPLVVPVPSSAPKKVETAVVTPATPAKASPANVEDEAIDGEPNFVNESPVVTEAKPVVTEKPAAKKEPVKAEPKKEVAAAKPAVAKPAAAPKASSGSYQVQLGAFKSEDEANAAWKKLSGKYGSVLGGSQSIVKADLPNGTFYRLRAGSFASGDTAKAACAKLGGAACYPVAK